jgi:hypothetical protein
MVVLARMEELVPNGVLVCYFYHDNAGDPNREINTIVPDRLLESML